VRDWLDWPEFKQVDALREANITLHLSARGVAFRLLHVLGNGADYRHNAQLVQQLHQQLHDEAPVLP
jgi:hypothetical protein